MQTIWQEYKEFYCTKCILNDIKQPWKCHELHLHINSLILANPPLFLNEISFIFDLGGWHLAMQISKK